MIIISDSGSTKTDWCLIEKGEVVNRISTKGINPFYQSEEEIAEEVKTGLMPFLKGYVVTYVYFYGAGCAFPEKNEIVRQAIVRNLPVPVEVGSDMLAAARASCGRRPGIACILGTGSNSCFYDGGGIVKNVSPSGFILGDEGSGATLGKLLVGDLLKGLLPEVLKNRLLAEYDLTPAEIMDKVYRQPFPNRFLAGFSPFLSRNRAEPAIRSLLLGSFRAFFVRNVMQYDCRTYPVCLTGSVAFYFQEIIREVAKESDIRIETIEQSPMSGLVAFHSAFDK